MYQIPLKKKQQKHIPWWRIIVSLILIFWCIFLVRLYLEQKAHQKYVTWVVQSFSQEYQLLSDQISAYGFSWINLPILTPDTVSFETMETSDIYFDQIRSDVSRMIDVQIEEWTITQRRLLDIPHLLKTLSPQEKIAQLFIFGIPETVLSDEEEEFLKSSWLWGIILMKRNVSDELLTLIDAVQATNKAIPLFIAVDQEWGPVKRLEEDLVWQKDITQETLCPTYSSRGELLRGQWINMNFWIVADTTTKEKSFMKQRVFPSPVSTYVSGAVECTTDTLSTLKHYPWHWVVLGDSHTWVQTTAVSCEQLAEKHLQSFAKGIDVGADLVMMSHITVPCVDKDWPASLSSKHAEQLRALWFTGLIITDDMEMIRYDYERKDSLKQSLISGNDIILTVEKSEKRQDMLDYSMELYASWVLTDEMINSRLERIFAKKNKIIKLDEHIDWSVYKRWIQ